MRLIALFCIVLLLFAGSGFGYEEARPDGSSAVSVQTGGDDGGDDGPDGDGGRDGDTGRDGDGDGNDGGDGTDSGRDTDGNRDGVVAPGSGSGSRWSYALYSKYSHTTFKDSALARQPIRPGFVDLELLSAAIFYATNVERARHGRPLFRPSTVLYKAALAHSQDMVRLNFFSHTSPVAGRRTPSARVQQFGQWRRTVGENIADTFAIRYKAGTRVSSFANIPPHSYWSFGVAVVNSWMNSPGHRRNILNGNFGRLGAAGVLHRRGGHNIPYIKATQVFAGDTND